ncbi:YndM family protein [Halobacillus shinanisalinarum]|uniref:YndM family protein n=1 Tax=Halobacillus shinanisalinarum TaxID=2932258 RepID=A0ABY4H3C2_9BACI|nr:YndM family protein [Halobacillus shinanisalinarum]UOQ94668.1 YndM family protein [Halobacillus shinanisalinarum]
MKYIQALLIKFVMMTAVLWFFLGVFFGISFFDILITSIALTVVSYIIGDLLILPNIGNTAATVADMFLAFVGVWVLGSLLFETSVSLGTISFFLAIAITIGEFFFHGYMKKLILKGLSSEDKASTDLFAEK